MKKYLVLYSMPYAGLKDWSAKPEAERKEMEDQMKKEWDEWAAKQGPALIETAGAGATIKINQSGASDTHNDLMMYSMVSTESKEAVTAMFVGHPHLQIPDSWIEVMEANVLPGMQK